MRKDGDCVVEMDCFQTSNYWLYLRCLMWLGSRGELGCGTICNLLTGGDRAIALGKQPIIYSPCLVESPVLHTITAYRAPYHTLKCKCPNHNVLRESGIWADFRQRHLLFGVHVNSLGSPISNQTTKCRASLACATSWNTQSVSYLHTP